MEFVISSTPGKAPTQCSSSCSFSELIHTPSVPAIYYPLLFQKDSSIGSFFKNWEPEKPNPDEDDDLFISELFPKYALTKNDIIVFEKYIPAEEMSQSAVARVNQLHFSKSSEMSKSQLNFSRGYEDYILLMNCPTDSSDQQEHSGRSSGLEGLNPDGRPSPTLESLNSSNNRMLLQIE